MRKLVLALFVSSILVSGCASSRKSGIEELASVEPSQIAGHKTEFKTPQDKAKFEEAKKMWANRHDQATLEKTLATLEQIDKTSPGVYEVLTMLCRGYYLLADGHLEDVAKKKEKWEKGAFWGEKAMAVNTAFYQKVVKGKQSIEDALDTLTPGEVDALYWHAVNLGKWAKASGIGTTLKYKGKIKSMIEKVEQLNPNQFYGAVHRYWGVYFAVAPGFAGGSMSKSKESFEKSFEMANNYLATHVLYAENYAVKESDKELFKKELEFVIKADANAVPEIMPENVLEKKKAQKLLAKMDDLF